MVDKIKNQVGDEKSYLALSGGVDSSVVAAILNKAIGKNLICIFIDTGLLRKHEVEEVKKITKALKINLKLLMLQENSFYHSEEYLIQKKNVRLLANVLLKHLIMKQKNEKYKIFGPRYYLPRYN